MFIFKRGKYYHLEYFDEDGRLCRITTGERKKTDALNFLANFRRGIKRKSKLTFITLEQFRVKYYDYACQTMSENYCRNIESSFKFLGQHFSSDTPIKNIRMNQLESILLQKFQTAKFSSALTYRTIKSAFQKAVQWGYITHNPIKEIKLPKIPKSFPAFINNIELNLIVQNTKSGDLKDIFLTGYHSGMRLSEIINIKWSAINLSERTIIVQNSKTFTTKSKKERMIPINGALATVLNNRIPKVLNINLDEYVFCKYPGVPYLKDYVSKNFKRVVRTLKMSEKIHFHTLRHSTASNMVQAGVSLYVVKEILGHEDLSTTQIYSHLQKENLISAVKTLDTQAVNLINN